jgi:SAM-dependent methyltransferase
MDRRAHIREAAGRAGVHERVPENGRVEDAGLGYAATLEAQRRAWARTAGDLCAAASGRRLDAPFFFDSAEACISTYVEALGHVRERFWTTTRLHSGFWTVRDPRIIEANARMMRRVRARGNAVRRLFLLDQPPERVAQAYRDQRVLLDQLGNHEELERLDDAFETLKQNLRALEADGCELRVTHDADGRYRTLPEGMAWRPDDSELAIYDRFRVDAFGGGRTGRITNVRSFSRVMRGFEEHLAVAETFFSELWEKADAMARYLARLDRAVAASKNRIAYRSNWLARYEYALDAEDEALKTAEARSLAEALRTRGRWGRLGRCLDVGTCTGRYLLFLRDAVRPGGRIVGLDDNLQCVQFARANVEREAPDDPRIRILHGDFGARRLPLDDAPFHLITCMMSTLSHFGRDRNDRFDDALQATLRRMRRLLEPGGVLVFSLWSGEACRTRRFLAIYRPEDDRRLTAWTPGAEETARRLAAAGFAQVERLRPDPRLDLWICERG